MHLFGGDGFAMLHRESQGLVERDGGIERAHGDAEVVDGGRGRPAHRRFFAGTIDGREQFRDAGPFGRNRADNRGRDAARQAQHGLQFTLHAVCAGLIGLVDHEHVGDLHDACLDGLHVVAHAGHQHHHGHLRQSGDLHFVLPHADGLDQHVIAAGASIRRARSRVARGQAAQRAASRHRADENSRIGMMLLHADAVAQNGAASGPAARVHRQNRHGLALLPQCQCQAIHQRALTGARAVR